MQYKRVMAGEMESLFFTKPKITSVTRMKPNMSVNNISSMIEFIDLLKYKTSFIIRCAQKITPKIKENVNICKSK